MEREHTESVVDRAVAYVRDMLGIPAGDKPRDDEVAGESGTETPYEREAEEASGMYPQDTLKSAAELNAESARREDGE